MGGVRVRDGCGLLCGGLPIDSGGHEEQVGAHEGPHQREGDGRCLVHTHQLCLVQLVAVRGVDVLEGGKEGPGGRGQGGEKGYKEGRRGKEKRKAEW